MNWVECSQAGEASLNHTRFMWPADGLAGINCEPGVSYSDITGGIAWMMTYLGDYILRIPAVNAFLELAPNHTGGYLSAAISVAAFFAVIFAFAVVSIPFILIGEAIERWKSRRPS